MYGMREHVHGAEFFECVAAVSQDLKVSGQGGRVAGYVDDPLGGCLQDGI